MHSWKLCVLRFLESVCGGENSPWSHLSAGESNELFYFTKLIIYPSVSLSPHWQWHRPPHKEKEIYCFHFTTKRKVNNKQRGTYIHTYIHAVFGWWRGEEALVDPLFWLHVFWDKNVPEAPFIYVVLLVLCVFSPCRGKQ